MTTATSTPSVTAAEREIYRGYDRQRRLDLTRGIAPAFGVILAVFVIIVNIDLPILAQQKPGLFPPPRIFTALLVGDPLYALCVIGFIASTMLARRNQVGPATTITIICTDVAVILVDLQWAFGLGGYDYVSVAAFSALAMAIMLSGVLGDRWMVIATTLTMNVVVTILGIFAMPPHPAFETDSSIAALADSQKLIVISGAWLVQWAVASIMLTAGRATRRILRELGDVRIAYERAKQLDELKDLFISSVNHELRSPVMAMQGYLELLHLTEETASAEKRRSLLQRAITAADNLVALLQSILDARRLDKDADDFIPEAVNVRSVINIAAGLIDPREGEMATRELRVSVPPNLYIWGEQVRLQQILTNLISNAVKYSDPGTPVEITARLMPPTITKQGRFGRSTKVERPMAEIMVRDYGLGIPPNQAPLLFQRFVRLPRDLAGTTIGNGLGLHLCRVLAEAMKGRIWLESTGIPGEGTTFHLVLPVPEHVTESDASNTPTKRVRDSVPMPSH
jgi:signal transduction histidine kinase